MTDRPEDFGAAAPGAGEVTATVLVKAPAVRVFAALIDWERQSEWIPFTRVRVLEGDGGEGSLIEAVTALGPAVLRDRMRVVRFDEPYEVRVVHLGRVLRGPGVLRCTPLARDRTAMTRSFLSRPLQQAYAVGLLDGDFTVFDYGCGL